MNIDDLTYKINGAIFEVNKVLVRVFGGHPFDYNYTGGRLGGGKSTPVKSATLLLPQI